MQTTLQAVLEIDSELENYYKSLLEHYNLDKMDGIVMEFEKETRDTKGQLPNERIRYYSSMFSYYAYALNATLSRQGLRSDVAELFLDQQSARAYITTDPQDGKLTREDKQARAKISTENESKVNILYARVTQAIETRIKAFNKLIETLNMLGAMNMSEAKLGARQ